MRQYQQIKTKYPGALILFRVGDFYETFSEDAVKASKILDIVLTKRSNGKASHVELAGFPHHALDNYLPRLVRAGLRVAICDQLEEPQKGKKLVKRGVTELVTPGVTLNDKVLESRSSNYLCCLSREGKDFGIAFLELSTGEFMVAEGQDAFMDKLLRSLKPSEILYSKNDRSQINGLIREDDHTYVLDPWIVDASFGRDRLLQHFKTANLKGFGVEDMGLASAAAGACLYYLEQTHHNLVDHISSISRIDERNYLWMDPFTIRNLELLRSNHHEGKGLIDILDQTSTPMGGRLLKRWAVLPLLDPQAIEARHTVVAELFSDPSFRDEVSAALRPMGDLERLASKVATQRISPRELIQLKRALICVREIHRLGTATTHPAYTLLAKEIENLDDVIDRIDTEIEDDAPHLTHKGGIFREKVDEELDELRNIAFSGKDYLASIQKRESERTGIPSLKIAFNNVFGYYIEVTNTHRDKVPAEWIRKQTLVNAERYITEELKEYETKILTAEERINQIETKRYADFINSLLEKVRPIQQNAQLVARIDSLLSFALVSAENNFCRPTVDNSRALALHECRHPVIEQQLPPGEAYIPNDLLLNTDDQQLIILTGPNMSGKSALLRQTALAVIMAQMGCFVAAKHAQIGIVDKVYTRVGASDNISQGESTFMVEMTETASILNNLSDRSLILLDEIGRGTSTFDGVSLAWSIAEFLAGHETRPKTLFATHYHELNELENKLERVVNYHVTTREVGKKVLFLRKIERGGSEHSFGIHVARMAGIPNSVVRRADQILAELEKDRMNLDGREKLKKMQQTEYQLNLFSIDDPRVKEITEQLGSLDTNTLTPIEALLKLNELKKTLEA
ncbi:MAG: DNA mismatch repair protein MutS [Flavobacteriales bacterium]|nr:DNA mismatch repair protein MutS [Bacteroidota bacterium]MCB9239928.1 DNA mismatch repair protein MutS [Flavobacteriales bacterium]